VSSRSVAMAAAAATVLRLNAIHGKAAAFWEAVHDHAKVAEHRRASDHLCALAAEHQAAADRFRLPADARSRDGNGGTAKPRTEVTRAGRAGRSRSCSTRRSSRPPFTQGPSGETKTLRSARPILCVSPS
jgi:hypothetical protein